MLYARKKDNTKVMLAEAFYMERVLKEHRILSRLTNG
jgi:hypothetical protein